MPRSAPPPLTRLRHHRGLWVLAVAVLLIKLVASTACLTDAPGKQTASRTAMTSSAAVASNAATSDADAAGGCVLGEAGGCHCACAHTMPMPAAAPLPIARVKPHFEPLAFDSGFEPASTGSLLRPPIA